MNTANNKESGQVTWKSPSNIALVKYWGKRDIQLPMNPSLSFTLTDSYTETTVSYKRKTVKGISFDVFFEGKQNPDFYPKIEGFFERIEAQFGFLGDYYFKIESRNTFPHSAGIASSASAMSALALCMCTIEEDITGRKPVKDEFFRKASVIARLGSGSAARSVYGGAVLWGKTNCIDTGSDDFAVPLSTEIHPVFRDYRDTILIVSSKKKKVSSTSGHASMKDHPFADARYIQAEENICTLVDILENGDEDSFGRIVENEALTLHSLMMSSKESYTLLKPNTLNIIDEIREFRESSGISITFTLDAGPNVHILYSSQNDNAIMHFIKDKLLRYCEEGRIIEDRIGSGPVRIL